MFCSPVVAVLFSILVAIGPARTLETSSSSLVPLSVTHIALSQQILFEETVLLL